MSPWQLRQARWHLHSGGILAYPTEAVWGLGCDPHNPEALERVLQIKRRPWHKGLILIASDWSQLQPWLRCEQPPAMAENVWPGPYTFLLPCRENVSPLLKGDHDCLAVRISAHPPVRALCEATGQAIVSTSANRHGRPTPDTLLRLRHEFGQEIDYYCPDPLGSERRPSRIIDGQTGEILRA